MDGFTLSLASAFISLVMALSLMILWYTSPRQWCLLDWAGAGLLFFCSNLISIMTICQLFPEWLAPVLVNLTYICGHAAILVGLRRHLQRTAHWDYVLVLALLIIFLHTTPFVQASVGHRVAVFYPLLMLINSLVLWQLWRLPKPRLHPAYWLILLAEGLFLLQLSVRFVWMLLTPGPLAEMAAAEWLLTSGTLAVLLFLLLVTIGCVLIVMRSQELTLRMASLIDPLTLCRNRRALAEVAPRELARAQRTERPLAMLMLDIDHFKAVNDQFGHQVGDQVLQQISHIAAQELRGYDQLFRLGGEEFLAVLSDVDEQSVMVVAERVRSAVQDFEFQHNSQQFQVSISVGIANLCKDDLDWQAMLQRADRALYLAKAQGRNQVCVAENIALTEVVIT